MHNFNFSNIYLYNYTELYCFKEEYAQRIAFALFIALGIFGNIFVIILALKYTVRKNLHHLIINMAVSDTLYLFMMMLDIVQWLPDSNLGKTICQTLTFLQQVSYRVSLITLFVISIERFRATKGTLQMSRPYTLKEHIMKLGISWLVPIIIAAFYSYSLTIRTVKFCFTFELNGAGDNERLLKFLMLVSHLCTVFLCFIILFLSIVTTRRLSRRQAIEAHMSEDQQKMRAQRTRAAVRMVVVSALLYILCWLPSFFFSSIFAFHMDRGSKIIPYAYRADPSCGLFFIIFPLTFLPIVNSCFSPFIYIIFLRDFREAAKKVLCRKETVSQSQNTRSSHELQPMPKPVQGSSRMQNCDEAAIINMSKATKEKKSKIKELSGSSTNNYS